MSGLRDDYKELVNLALIYTRIQSSLGFTPQRPGAVSRARWMRLSLFHDDTSQSVKAKVAEALNQQINQEKPKTFRKK